MGSRLRETHRVNLLAYSVISGTTKLNVTALTSRSVRFITPFAHVGAGLARILSPPTSTALSPVILCSHDDRWGTLSALKNHRQFLLLLYLDVSTLCGAQQRHHGARGAPYIVKKENYGPRPTLIFVFQRISLVWNVGTLHLPYPWRR